MNDQTENHFFEEISTPIDDHFYKLNGQEPVHCTLAEYAQSMSQESNRIVAQNTVNNLFVSTIFTGIDHSFGMGEKRLFETVIFGMEDDIHPKWQHATWNEAVEKHHQLVKMIEKNGIDLLKQQIRKKTDK